MKDCNCGSQNKSCHDPHAATCSVFDRAEEDAAMREFAEMELQSGKYDTDIQRQLSNLEVEAAAREQVFKEAYFER